VVVVVVVLVVMLLRRWGLLNGTDGEICLTFEGWGGGGDDGRMDALY
jgi:hypothetical protein